MQKKPCRIQTLKIQFQKIPAKLDQSPEAQWDEDRRLSMSNEGGFSAALLDNTRIQPLEVPGSLITRFRMSTIPERMTMGLGWLLGFGLGLLTDGVNRKNSQTK